MSKYNKIGYILVMVGGLFWALSGVCGQYLFMYKDWDASWLVPVRLLSAGIILILISCKSLKKEVFNIFKDKIDFKDMVVFGLFGAGLSQLSYFITIQHSNAATGTVLNYIGPVVIIVYLAIRNRKLPSLVETICVAFVVIGTFFIATHGNPSTLAISQTALIWGLISAVATAVYSVKPQRIIQKFGTVPVAGWGMLVAGLFLSVFLKPWHLQGTYDLTAMAAFGVIVIIGTVLSYSFFLEGIRRIGPVYGSVLGATEPLGATVMSVLWLKVKFSPMDFLGFALITSTIFILAWHDTVKAKRAKEAKLTK